MKDIIGHEEVWYPFASFGLKNSFFALNTHTLYYTWVTIIVLTIVLTLTRFLLYKNSHSVGSFIIKAMGKNFMQLIQQSLGHIVYRYYLFIGALFIYILSCNWIALIPTCEEPTKDLNTTLALGIIAFIFVQREVVKAHGLKTFLKEYFMPFSFMFPLNLLAGLLVLPLKLLGEFASIISISFRLFGNIFGGSIITLLAQRAVSGSIVANMGATFLGFNLLITGFFIVFEGFLQAFVFSILTLTNIVMALQAHEPENSDVEPFEFT